MPDLNSLNERQREAVEHTEGPLLILAGAGSGKTRVLTYRIAHLIEKGVYPWEILAITFTNKAAGEMRERVDAMLGGSGANVFVSTFHSMCVRFLKKNIERLGYGRDFTIYDTDDQRTLMRQIIKDMGMDSKIFRERGVLGVISSQKNEMTDCELYAERAGDFYEKNVARLYIEYQTRLRANNAVDFDDILLLTVKLFKENPDVLMGYQERFRYIMVDEYQDTNTVQFELVRLLSAKHRNLCVVGDDDQSIYKFRGANIENILSFEKAFPGACVIKLEQNYRSTKNILNTANEVIKNNNGRKEKRLWTDNEEGEEPTFKEYDTAGAEADAVVSEAASCGIPLKDQAVLYRTNAQSRLIEERCIARNVPYRMVGGVNFYQRKEIKDVLSYLKVTANGVDDLAVERIINVPKRGIGATTVSRVKDYARINSLSMYDALKKAREIPGIGAAAKKIEGFVDVIEGFKEKSEDPQISIKDLIESVKNDTGYVDELKKDDEIEAQTRIENIDELINKAVGYEEDYNNDDKSLAGFLEEVSLVADIDNADFGDDRLTLMTLHSAKGLEFDKVYLVGMEEGLFPSASAINSENPELEVEEERRLCYVGITRARKILRMSSARERMINGEMRYEKPSRFVAELPDDTVKKEMRSLRPARWEDYDDDYESAIPRSRSFKNDPESFAGKYGFGTGTGKYSYRADTAYGSISSHADEGGVPGRNVMVGSFGSLDKTNKRPASKRVSFGKEFSVQKPASLDYKEGDRVSHIKFGTGTVKRIVDGPKDYEVTVDFDNYGEKRMFAGFAKLKKC